MHQEDAAEVSSANTLQTQSFQNSCSPLLVAPSSPANLLGSQLLKVSSISLLVTCFSINLQLGSQMHLACTAQRNKRYSPPKLFSSPAALTCACETISAWFLNPQKGGVERTTSIQLPLSLGASVLKHLNVQLHQLWGYGMQDPHHFTWILMHSRQNFTHWWELQHLKDISST